MAPRGALFAQYPEAAVAGVVSAANGRIYPLPLADEYETVAASQTAQMLGTTGATDDYLEAVIIVPATTSPGAVQIKDGSAGAITIFAGGASSVADLRPIAVRLGLRSVTSPSGGWQITTGANVSAIAVGDFT